MAPITKKPKNLKLSKAISEGKRKAEVERWTAVEVAVAKDPY